MRWALLWTFVAGGAAAAAVKETRVPPVEVAALAPEPAIAREVDEAPRAAPPRGGFGGVPSTEVPTISPREVEVSDGPAPVEPTELDSVGDVLDESDRCPIDQADDVTGDEDGCPEPTVTTIYTHDGRRITMSSTIVIFDGERASDDSVDETKRRDLVRDANIIIY